MRQKIEIMHFKQGKLCVTKVELCAKLCHKLCVKLCANIYIVLHTFRLHFLLKKVKTKNKGPHLLKVLILTENINTLNKYIETLKHIITY